MRELLPIIEAWEAEGLSMARAVVIRTYGSSPRREGATMLRAADGRIAGSVSGGCVEGATAEYLEAAAIAGAQRVVRFGVSDSEAWDVGLACGGTIDVLVQPTIPGAVLEAARATLHARHGGRCVITPLPEGSPASTIGASEAGPSAAVPRPLVILDHGLMAGSTGVAADDSALLALGRAAISRGTSSTVEHSGRGYFIESFPVRPRLVVVGAVEVAVVLVRLARELGFETAVIDGRPAFATRERFPEVDELVIGWPDEVADRIELGPGDAVAVLSHDPKFDDPAITEALRRECRYVGAIGSRATQRARRERLSRAGLSHEQVARLRGPIGLDLGGREPAETALAILSEVVAARHEGSGRPMRDLTGERRPRA